MTRRTEEPVPASGKSGGFLEMLKTNPLIRWLIVGAAAAVVVFAVIFPAAGIYGGKDIPAATEGSDPLPLRMDSRRPPPEPLHRLKRIYPAKE